MSNTPFRLNSSRGSQPESPDPRAGRGRVPGLRAPQTIDAKLAVLLSSVFSLPSARSRPQRLRVASASIPARSRDSSGKRSRTVRLEEEEAKRLYEEAVEEAWREVPREALPTEMPNGEVDRYRTTHGRPQ